jgi:hypothetical protein
MSSLENNDLVERLVEGWQAALEKLGFCYRVRAYLSFDAAPEAWFLAQFSDRAGPDAAIALPDATQQQDLIARAESSRMLFAHADHDAETTERRIDRRRQYQVVVETHGRVNPVHWAKGD